MDTQNRSHANLLAQPFVKAALDPNLIAGIYNYCDQWCMYCPATARCLAYRCRPPGATEEDPQDVFRNIADRLYESLHFVKELTSAEGRTIPELEAMLSSDPREIAEIPVIDDPLERMGRRYAAVSSRYLASRPDFPFIMKRHADGPTPFEVIAWFHVLIAAKIYRALASGAAAARGHAESREDALGSAKAAMISIDRSREAIGLMKIDDDDPRLDEMFAHLRRLAREIEARFPEARAFVRPGLDAGPAPAERA